MAGKKQSNLKKIVGRRALSASKVLHVGDMVQVMFGAQSMKGKVVEDRGRIGYKGRNLYRILVQAGMGELMNIELPAEEIRVTRRVPISRKGHQHGHMAKVGKAVIGTQKPKELTGT
jgi:hypothetical protein